MLGYLQSSFFFSLDCSSCLFSWPEVVLDVSYNCMGSSSINLGYITPVTNQLSGIYKLTCFASLMLLQCSVMQLRNIWKLGIISSSPNYWCPRGWMRHLPSLSNKRVPNRHENIFFCSFWIWSKQIISYVLFYSPNLFLLSPCFYFSCYLIVILSIKFHLLLFHMVLDKKPMG